VVDRSDERNCSFVHCKADKGWKKYIQYNTKQIHTVLMLRILYSVLLMCYCLRIVHYYVTLPPGIGPIAVGNIYNYCNHIFRKILEGTRLEFVLSQLRIFEYKLKYYHPIKLFFFEFKQTLVEIFFR
jgi:hypothetical protein